jgi:hypothetical protein
MHSKGDVQTHGNKIKFTPNTITYGADKNSEHGMAALKSQIGVAVHTAYKGKDLESMKAEYAPALNKFGKHPDVHVISTEHKLDGAHYKPEHQQQFAKHMKAAAVLHKSMPEEGYDAVVSHNIPLKTYINHTVRHGTTPTLAGFKKHFEASHQKKIDSVKTDKAKASKTEAANADMAHVSTNRAHFQRALDMHKHLQKAKDILTHTMSKSSEFEHSINGKKAKPEGFVAVRYNRPTKFVDRSEFSAANFNKDKNL